MIEGLIYFEDWNGNQRLCAHDSLWVEVMSEVHNILTESAQGHHAKIYNCISSTYYKVLTCGVATASTMFNPSP